MSTKNVESMDIEFRKRVALTMLPIIYKDTDSRGHLVDDRARIAAKSAAEIAELLDIFLEQD